MAVSVRDAGVSRDGQEIKYIEITGPAGMKMECTNFGCIITKLFVPDRDGKLVDVVLGFDEMEDYFTRSPKCGALIGRYANRIDKSSFELNGKTYELDPSHDGYTIHGGPNGFDKHVFSFEQTGPSEVTFKRTSPDGEAGFPGTMDLAAVYTLTGDNALELKYVMQSDKDTAANITNHSYFNLSGAGEGDILDHVVTIASDSFCEADERAVPTGRMLSVEGTPMDFRSPHKAGERIEDSFEQLSQFNGYDHNYALGEEKIAASAWSPKTGILMEVETTMPGVQFFTANGMNLENAKDGKTYGKRAGLCFETQFYPDSPHHPEFPSCVLPAGEKVEQTTVYRFSVRDSE